ncbi:MAG: amino acid ABC transporter substrate-binding protein [Natronomonas sp.]
MSQNRRRFLSAVSSTAIGIGLAGCLGNGGGNGNGNGNGNGGNGGGTTGNGNGNGDPITFGLPTSLSGRTAQLGTDYLRGYKIWRDDVNDRGGLLDRQVEIIEYDDESTPDRARELADRLVSQDNVDFLFGPYGSPTNNAASIVADQTQTPMITGAASSPQIFDRELQFFYSVLSKTDEYGRTLPIYLDSLNWGEQPIEQPETFASIRAEAAFTEDIGKAQIERFQEHDYELVYEDSYPLDIDDFSGILSQIEQADPDILLVAGFPPDEASFAEQMQQADVNVDIHNQNYSSQQVIHETLGDQANYMFNGAWWDKNYDFRRVDQYVEEWNSRDFDRPPEMPLAYATAAGMSFEEAISNAGSTDPNEVNQAIADLSVETTMGPTEFHETGWNVNAYEYESVRQWQDGENVLLYPEEFKTGEVWLPTPEWGNRDEPPA